LKLALNTAEVHTLTTACAKQHTRQRRSFF